MKNIVYLKSILIQKVLRLRIQNNKNTFCIHCGPSKYRYRPYYFFNTILWRPFYGKDFVKHFRTGEGGWFFSGWKSKWETIVDVIAK